MVYCARLKGRCASMSKGLGCCLLEVEERKSGALTKKARGLTSLWAHAVQQIPNGEIGFVYIAYPE
jgi:hypothetical protein